MLAAARGEHPGSAKHVPCHATRLVRAFHARAHQETRGAMGELAGGRGSRATLESLYKILTRLS